MQLIAKKPILVHDKENGVFNRVVQPGESFEIAEAPAAILIRDGEAEAATSADASESSDGAASEESE